MYVVFIFWAGVMWVLVSVLVWYSVCRFDQYVCSSFRAGVMLGVYYYYILLLYIIYYTYYILLYLILYSSLLLFSSYPLSLPSILSSFLFLIFLPNPSFSSSDLSPPLLPSSHLNPLFLPSFPPLPNPLLFLYNPLPPPTLLSSPNTHSKYTCRVFHILIYTLLPNHLIYLSLQSSLLSFILYLSVLT